MTINTAPLSIPVVRDSLARQISQLVLIFVAGLFIYGWKLGVPPIAGTEPLRALVAHQMVQSGEYLIPRIYGELYLRKPPLQYWIVAATEKAAGVGNEFIWRLPSAVGSALLAVFLAWWSARWFGDTARLVTGFSCLGLIALWAQDRGGDIDALDTLASILVACCILEIAFGTSGAKWLWTLLLGIASGAMLLLKGPAGLPTTLGAMAACTVLASGRRVLKKPWLWIGLVIGALVFAAWLLAVYLRVQSQHLTVDRSGAQEAGERMLIRPATAPQAFLAPILVLLYALPISLALPLAMKIAQRSPLRDRIYAIAATILGSLAVGILAGITNPRYSYVSMPLLAVLSGGVVAMIWKSEEFAELKKFLAGNGLKIACIIWAVANVVLTVMAFKKITKIDPREHVTAPKELLIGVALVSIAFAIVGLFVSSNRRAWIVAGLIVLLGIPFAEMKNAERTEFSGRAAGIELRQAMGESATISVASIIRDFPQLFYYADVPVRPFGEKGLRELAANPEPRWVLLTHDEYRRLSAMNKSSLTRVTELRMVKDTEYLAWYAPVQAQ